MTATRPASANPIASTRRARKPFAQKDHAQDRAPDRREVEQQERPHDLGHHQAGRIKTERGAGQQPGQRQRPPDRGEVASPRESHGQYHKNCARKYQHTRPGALQIGAAEKAQRQPIQAPKRTAQYHGSTGQAGLVGATGSGDVCASLGHGRDMPPVAVSVHRIRPDKRLANATRRTQGRATLCLARQSDITENLCSSCAANYGPAAHVLAWNRIRALQLDLLP